MAGREQPAASRRDDPWKCEGCGWTNLGYVPECDGCGESKATALLSRSGMLAEIDRLQQSEASWMKVAREYEAALSERSLL